MNREQKYILFWYLVMYDMLDVRNVKTTSGNICCQEGTAEIAEVETMVVLLRKGEGGRAP